MDLKCTFLWKIYTEVFCATSLSRQQSYLKSFICKIFSRISQNFRQGVTPAIATAGMLNVALSVGDLDAAKVLYQGIRDRYVCKIMTLKMKLLAILGNIWQWST